MPLNDPVLLNFCNETIRPLADRLGGLLSLLQTVPSAVQGQGLAAILGTTDLDLFRATPWTQADYDALMTETIESSGNGGRVELTNKDVIGIIRVIAALAAMAAANPGLGPLVGRVAVNPRA